MPLITEVSVQKRNSNRFNLFVDKQFYTSISVRTLADLNLYKGKEISQEELEKLLDTELYNRLFDRAVDYIDRGIRTERRIKDYIKETIYKKRGTWFAQDLAIDSDLIGAKIAARLVELGLINDYTFAKAYVEDRIRFRARSKYAIISELIGKGVSKEVAEQACNELIEDEYELLKSAYLKKYKSTPITQEDRKKIDFLLRKGFSWDLISQFIKENDQRE